VHVYDNAPYYITWYNPTVMNASVDGVSLPTLAAKSSAGQVFRGELPGNLVGGVSYSFTSQDEYGNTGSSTAANVVGAYVPVFQTAYGTSTSGLTGGVPALRSLSVPFAGKTVYLALSSNAAPSTAAIIAVATTSLPATAIPGLLTLNIAGTALVVVNSNLDANGDLVLAGELPATAPAGVHLFCQGWVLDATAGGEMFASSRGLDLVMQ
jgi:hypothetical protein